MTYLETHEHVVTALIDIGHIGVRASGHFGHAKLHLRIMSKLTHCMMDGQRVSMVYK